MQLEEQAAGVAEDSTRLIASPKRSGGSLAVLAGGLLRLLIRVSRHGRHDGLVSMLMCAVQMEKKEQKYRGNDVNRLDSADAMMGWEGRGQLGID